MRRIVLLSACACLLSSAHAGAQAIMVDAGTQIRVSVVSAFRQSPFRPRAERLRGLIRSISRDTLYIELPNALGRTAIPRARIRRVEISVGRSSRASAVKAGIIGAVILGSRMWVAAHDPENHTFSEPWQAATVGGAIGFAAGAWLGARHPQERWRAVRLRD
jgi:hypothetical protein